jgi:general secretion pathway protein A
MYLEHFELPRKPFESTPDVRFYYPAAAHEEALAKMLYAAENRLGAGLLWGPPGAGKTLVLELVRARLDPERYFVVRLNVPAESPEEMLYALLGAMGETELSALQGQVLAAALHRRVDDWLAAVRDSGRYTVALIDEAQALRDRRSLEAVRNLLSPSPGGERLMTLLLAGHEEFASRVARFAPLNERVEVRAGLGKLTEDEAANYLLRRIEAAGGRRGVFTRKGASAMATAAGCLPGALNRIAETCLVTAFAAGLDRVGPDVVAAVLEDMKTGAPAGAPTGGAGT